MNQFGTAVILLGDATAPEMQPVVALVLGLGNAVTLRQASDVDDLRRYAVEEQWFPDLIVALQAWPDQFSGGDVGDLLSLAPLACIVCVCGAWCDSEGRTRLNWPLAVRVPVPGAPDRIVRELATIRGEAAPLPLTAGRGEIFAADCAWSSQASPHSIQIAVVSPDRHWRRMITTAFCRSSHQIVVIERPPAPLAIVWDADPWDNERTGELHSLRNKFPHATIVACVGFVRDDLADELRVAGADAVWFKLAPLSTLLPLLEVE